MVQINRIIIGPKNRSNLFHIPLRWIQKCISMLKNSEVDRVILTVNAEKNYNVNETIEFVKELRKFCQ